MTETGRNLPYWKFFATDYLGGDIQAVPMAVQGVFINLCAHAWKHGGSIADEPERMSLLLRITADEYRAAVAMLLTLGCLIRLGDGALSTKWIQRQRVHLQDVSRKRSAIGKRGRAKQLAATDKQTAGNCRAIAQGASGIPDPDPDPESKQINPPPAGAGTPRGGVRRFIPPTVGDVAAFVAERNLDIDPDYFCECYGAKGWMIGRNQMKDWRLAAQKASREGWCKPGRDTWTDELPFSPGTKEKTP